jgi:hypothetical protein
MNVTTEDSDDGLCPHCGAKMVKYRHGISVPLVTGLRRLLHAGGGPINIKELGLTRNQWDNFQKLRYWGLVVQVEVDGQRKKGVWQITPQGQHFLFNEQAIPRRVWTYRGEFQHADGDATVRITEVVDWYEKREDYIRSSRPIDDDDQPDLF